MNLDDEQRNKVSEWIKQGLKLSDIQSRLDSELGLKMTYMDVRLLVDDLKLVPKDSERPKNATPTLGTAVGGTPSKPAPAGSKATHAPTAAPERGSVSVQVDQLARPGAVV